MATTIECCPEEELLAAIDRDERAFDLEEICYACGRPCVDGQKLLSCTRCLSAAYHDRKCQQFDWKVHKRSCGKMEAVLKPLHRILHGDAAMSRWWSKALFYQRSVMDSSWKEGYQAWQYEEYLAGVEWFQKSLDPIQNSWRFFATLLNDRSASEGEADAMNNHTRGDSEYDLLLAKRLLFCAYCEIDGQQVEEGRQRLIQCISVLMVLKHQWTPEHQAVWNDAWMELMLTMEEVDEHRVFAKNVAFLALSVSKDDHHVVNIRNACGWNNWWQRPGYMAPELGRSQPFVHRKNHPSWCQRLEEASSVIIDGYVQLRKSSQGWTKVGCGARGSGHDDQRVVVGNDWSEYVLFGTGAHANDTVTRQIRKIIQDIVPDAVSLAEQGGGEVIFSRLAPHTHIQAHCGPTNLRWTAHLGLVVPAKASQSGARCQIRVGATWHSWVEGEVLLFDDSFEHEVRNDTDSERVVLLLRIWHPSLYCQLRSDFLIEARQKKEDAIQKRYHPPLP